MNSNCDNPNCSTQHLLHLSGSKVELTLCRGHGRRNGGMYLHIAIPACGRMTALAFVDKRRSLRKLAHAILAAIGEPVRTKKSR